jgi:hypothetical protein
VQYRATLQALPTDARPVELRRGGGFYRILKLEGGRVTFRYRDRADGDTEKVMTLSAEVFIRRFLLHILPPGLQKIRFFGRMGRNVCKHNLQRIRQALGVTPPQREQPKPRPVPVCPHRSNAALVLTGEIEQARGLPA